MANSDLLAIWQGALGNIGAKASIASTTEQSAEAAACALHYKRVVEKIARETDWNCLRRRVALTEADCGDVWPPSWCYMYEYPADCFAIRGFDFGWGAQACVLPYEVADDSQAGRVLLVNVIDPTLIYTAYTLDLADAPCEAKFDASLTDAVTWALSVAIAGQIASNAPLVAAARQEAMRSLAQAQAANANESAPNNMDTRPAESLQVRGISDVDVYSYRWPYRP